MNSQDATPKTEGPTPAESSIKPILALLEAQNKQITELITLLAQSSDVDDADSDRVQLTDKGRRAVDAQANTEPALAKPKIIKNGRELTGDEYVLLEVAKDREPIKQDFRAAKQDFRAAFYVFGRLVYNGFISDPFMQEHWADRVENTIYELAATLHEVGNG